MYFKQHHCRIHVLVAAGNHEMFFQATTVGECEKTINIVQNIENGLKQRSGLPHVVGADTQIRGMRIYSTFLIIMFGVYCINPYTFLFMVTTKKLHEIVFKRITHKFCIFLESDN